MLMDESWRFTAMPLLRDMWRIWQRIDADLVDVIATRCNALEQSFQAVGEWAVATRGQRRSC